MTAPAPQFNWQNPTDVQDWIQERTTRNPLRNEHLSLTLDLLAVLQPDGHRILDLGCGDGLVAALLLERFPAAHLTGVDGSLPMLDQARAVGGLSGALDVARKHDAGAGHAEPARREFRRRHRRPVYPPPEWRGKAGAVPHGGGAIAPRRAVPISDRVRLASADLFPYHAALWNRLQAQHGMPLAPPDYSYAAHLVAVQARADQPDTVEDQMEWLRAAGFGAVDCFYRYVQRGSSAA